MRIAALIVSVIPFVLIYMLSAAEFHFYAPSDSMLKIAFKHVGKRLEECDEAGFLLKEAERYRRENRQTQGVRMNMGLLDKTGCSRERYPVELRLVVDGKVLLEKTYPPVGLKKDGASYIYERLLLEKGVHNIEITLKDGKDSPPYVLKKMVNFPPQRIVLVRFDDRKDSLIME